MGKILLLLYPTFSEFEIGVALSLVRRKHDVVTIGLTLQPVTSEGGLKCLPDASVAEVDAAEYDGLIIPGALDMIHVEGAESLYGLVRALHEAGRSIAAICGGPFVLGRAGVLEGQRYTVAFAAEQRAFLWLPEEGYVAEPLVRSGNLLTAQGSAFVEFGLALGDLLALYPDEADAAATADFFHNRLAI